MTRVISHTMAIDTLERISDNPQFTSQLQQIIKNRLTQSFFSAATKP